MKKFGVKASAEGAGGEYVLGLKDTGTHACYMIYGSLAPGQTGRQIKPGAGHEEIVMAVRGDLGLTGPFVGKLGEDTLREGEAFHIKGEATCFLDNPSETESAIYVVAGGHSEGGEHH